MNTNRKQEGSVNVGKSCIYETHKILNPQVKDVKKKAQGSDDPHSKWSQAGFLLAKQLNIRFGNIVPPFNDPPLSTTHKGNESKGIIDEIDLYLEINDIETNQQEKDLSQTSSKSKNNHHKENSTTTTVYMEEFLNEEEKQLLLQWNPAGCNTIEFV